MKKTSIKVFFPSLYPNLAQLTPISWMITIKQGSGYHVECRVILGARP